MQTSLLKKSAFILIFVLCLTSLNLPAKSIKQKMRERLPDIVALKDKGIIGENNKGFLEYVGSTKEKESIVNAENSDRKKVYDAIAKKQGTTSELVGKRRAAQIAENAKTGYWLQSPDGKWYKK